MRRTVLPALVALILAVCGTPAWGREPAAIFTPAPAPPGAFAARPSSPAVFAVVDREAMRRFRAAEGGRLAVPLPGGREATLALERFELLAPDARVVATGQAGATALTPDLTLFRGSVEGEPGSWAVLSMSADQVLGVISTAHGRFEIAPPALLGGPHAIAEEQALEPLEHRFRCSALEPPGTGLDLPRGRVALPEALGRPTPTRLVCSLSIDCDYELYANKFGGNLANETQYVLTVLGTVSLIYERDINVTLQVGFLNFWTAPDDPWTKSDMTAQLDEFGTWWTANRPGWPRQLGFLICGHSIGGGAAWIDGLCDYYRGFGVAQVDAWYSYPTNSTTWDVEVIAHEIGHSFGARHTHSCWWQDGGFAPAGTLIDTCYTPEGTCIGGYTLHVPPDKGTIMSYCHLLSPGIGNIRLDFHPACITVMRSRAQNTCLTAAPVQPPRDLIVTQAGAVNIVGWTASPSAGVLRYDVYRSPYRFDLNPTRIGSTTTTAFVDSFPGDYSYKTRAVRAADSSAFSKEARPAACGPRLLKSYGAGTWPVALIADDFDENGIPDLAVADSAGSRIVVLRGVRCDLCLDDYDVPRYAAVDAPPRALVPGDFDHDGALDLAVAGRGLLTFLKGQGGGGVGNCTFATGSTAALADTLPAGLVAGDFDEDGIADLAVAGAAGLTVLEGQGTGGVGNGAFAVSATYAIGPGAAAVAAGDFDEDGITDLAVAFQDSVAVLRGGGTGGKGNGSFGAPVSYAAAAQPSAIATGDFNEDGMTDLAVADAQSGAVVVLLGQGSGGVGNGTFGAATSWACGPRPAGLAVCDLDEDGITDLVTANAGDGTISFLPGLGTGDTGNGTFASPRTFAAGTMPRALAARDLDEDGRPDVVVANGVTPGTVSQLLFRCAGALSNALAITAPAGRELWVTGQERAIAWSRGAGVTAVNLELSRDGGTNWRSLATGLTETSFTWTATEPFTAQARFRVYDPAVPTRADASDSNVIIIPASAVDVPPAPAARLALEGARPNPVLGALVVSFSLAGGGAARLELFDLGGRRVRSLEVGALGPGPHRVELADGTPLAPGIYLVRLTQAGRSESARAVVLR